MSNIVLDYDEAQSLLGMLGNVSIEHLRYNSTLNSAMQKLMGYRNDVAPYPGAVPFMVHSFRMNDKIDTIKLIRHLSGWGLKEAKDFFDRSHEVVDGKYVVSLQLRKTSEEVHRIVSAAGGYYIFGG